MLKSGLKMEQVKKIAAQTTASVDTLDSVVRYIARRLRREQIIDYAVHVATQVLHIYQQSHPGDDRARRALSAAVSHSLGAPTTEESLWTVCRAAGAAAAVVTHDKAAYHALQAAVEAAKAASFSLIWPRRTHPEAVEGMVKVVRHSLEALSEKHGRPLEELTTGFLTYGLYLLSEPFLGEDLIR